MVASSPGTVTFTASFYDDIHVVVSCDEGGDHLPEEDGSCCEPVSTHFAPTAVFDVFDVMILQENADITGTTNDVDVGEQINLSIHVLPEGTTATNIQWTIPGTVVKSYAPSSASAQAMAPSNTDLQSSSPTIYWGDAANGRTISVSGNVDGVNFSTQATFNISAPNPATPTVSLPAGGHLNINNLTDCSSNTNGPYLVFGNLSGPNCSTGAFSGQAGIIFTPATIGNTSTPSGNFFFVQLITGDTVTYSRTGSTLTCTATNGLDGNYPYQGATGQAVPDAPNAPLLSTYTTASRSFGATMYLMWQSNTSGSIPVPMGSVDWSFSGSTTQSNGTWGTPSGSGSAQAFAAASGISSFPHWSGLAVLPNNNCH